MEVIKIKDILNNNFRLSPSNYNTTITAENDNLIEISNFIEKIDKGTEIGAQNYVDFSEYHFLRTSAFNADYYSLKIDNNSLLNIVPHNFIKKNLKKDAILICKDSNVGEVSILDTDLPNTMFSSGINRIYFKRNPKLFYALMKNFNFKKQLTWLIPKGATLKHAKDLYLKCKVPKVTNEKDIQYIENLVDIIVNKEIEIKKKKNNIDNFIVNEIDKNQKSNQYAYIHPSISELKKINRLDTGNYTKEFKNIDFKLKNYKNGYFKIDSNNIKGGNTPKNRYISNKADLKYWWITPSFINDNGILFNNFKINCEKNNINENCALVINRTSKGGFGEYVGITTFYDYDKFGAAQHNQGLYKIYDYDNKKLLYIVCLMNSPYYRKYCANLSMGSKMKELKLNNIIDIPFPNFDESKVQFILDLYYNPVNKNHSTTINENNFVKLNGEWDNNAGILDIYMSLEKAKTLLNNVIDLLYCGKDFEKNYLVF